MVLIRAQRVVVGTDSIGTQLEVYLFNEKGSYLLQPDINWKEKE